MRKQHGARGSSSGAASVADETDVDSVITEKRSPDHADHTAVRRRSSLFLHDSGGFSVPSRLRFLRVFLAFVGVAPVIGGAIIGPLMFDHAPSYLMHWAAAPVMLLSLAFLSLVTIVSRAQLDHFFQGTVGLWTLLAAVGDGLYLGRELGWFYGICWVVYITCTIACAYIWCERTRLAVRCAQARSLQDFLEKVFLVYAEFMVIVVYGTTVRSAPLAVCSLPTWATRAICWIRQCGPNVELRCFRIFASASWLSYFSWSNCALSTPASRR